MIEKIKNCSIVLSGFSDKIIDNSLYDFILKNNLNYTENTITDNNHIKAVIICEDIDFISHKSAKIKRALMSGIPIISLKEIKDYVNND